MNFKVDLLRQTFIIYCTIALSGCLGVYCGFLTLLHTPMMSKRYKFAVFLDLDVFKSLMKSFLIVSITSFVSSTVTLIILALMIRVKFRKKFNYVLRPLILINTILMFVNVWSVLLMVDPIGYLHTNIQYNFHGKMLSYGLNKSRALRIKAAIDRIQIQSKCCGINGPSDWFNVKWLSYEAIKRLENNQNKFGFVSLAPFSCCDRRKAIFCSIHDKKPLRHYYQVGCRTKLAEMIEYKILTREFVLVAMVTVSQFIILLLLKIIHTSLHTMLSGKYGKNVGQASFGTSMSTRALELESRGVPLLMPSTQQKVTSIFKRETYIKKKMKIGCLVNGTTYLRSIRKSQIISTFQHFLKKYLPIFEAVMFDNDPGYLVVMFRFICKGVGGWLIGRLFLLAFSPKIDSQATNTLTLVCTYTILITFPYAFIKSSRFRCVAVLVLPNLGMKSGRTFLVTELAQITALGPMTTLASNIQQVMTSLHCFMVLAQNITADAQRLGLNPMKDLILRSIEKSDLIKKLTLDAYSASQSINSDIKNADNQTHEIRKQIDKNASAAGADGNSRRQKDLKQHFSRLLTKLDRKEQIKFQRKTEKLRQHYRRLQILLKRTMVNIDRYQDIFSNKSSEIGSKLRTKMLSACASIELAKARMCQAVVMKACRVIKRATLYAPVFSSLCGDELDSQSSCSTEKAMKRAKKCLNDQRVASNKEGFGAAVRSTDRGLVAMTQIFDFNVRWNFSRPKFNLSAQKMMHGTASLALKITDSIQVFVDLLVLLFSLLKIMIMLVVLRSYKYYKKYMSNLDFDNIHVTAFFESIDKQRKRDGRTSLLPFKSKEAKKLIYKQLLYTSSEKKKILKNAVRMGIVLYSMATVFVTSTVLYEALHVLQLLTEVELRIEARKLMNMTTRGEGVVKELVDIMLEEMSRMARHNVTYSLKKCAPNVKPVPLYYRRMFIVLAVILVLLVLCSGYLVRSRHAICAYFYPARERRRLCHLYNRLLLVRQRTRITNTNIIIHKVRSARLAIDDSFLLSLRQDYPGLRKLAKKLGGKYRCLICGDKERSNTHICPHDNSAYCARCFSDLGDACMVCTVLAEGLMDPNTPTSSINSRSKSDLSILSGGSTSQTNNAWGQLSSDDADNGDSAGDTVDSGDYSDVQRMIEDSREVVGWSQDPIDVLQRDIEAMKVTKD